MNVRSRNSVDPRIFKGKIASVLSTAVITLFVVLQSACSLLPSFGKQPPPPPEINIPVPLSEQAYSVSLTVLTRENTNLDQNGSPRPIRLLVFLNKPDVNITQKEFRDVFQLSDGSVKPTLALTLSPNEKRLLNIEGTRDHPVLAVAAAYRDPFQVVWIDELTVDTSANNSVMAELRDIGINLSLQSAN